MALTDRAVADLRAKKALDNAVARFMRAMATARVAHTALTFRRALSETARELQDELVETYVAPAVSEGSTVHAELIAVIKSRVEAFISSTTVSTGTANPGQTMREAMSVRASVTGTLRRDFELAVHAAQRNEGAASLRAITVLLLTANPDRDSPLDVDREQNRIIKVRNGSRYQERVRVETVTDVDLADVSKSLRLHSPAVVHFSGHGGVNGALLMRDHNGDAYGMQPDGIARLVGAQQHPPRLVVLNACFSDELAQLLTPHVECVIGMCEAVSDDAAILFAQALYGSLFDGESVGRAFATASALVAARFHDQAHIPVLRTHEGRDAEQVKLMPLTRLQGT